MSKTAQTIIKELLLTHVDLLKYVSYNPETGIFTRNHHRKGRKIGEVVGFTNVKGYVIININDRAYRAHRLAWFYVTGSWPVDQIDHKDTIKHHNWFDNLREADNNLNQKNKIKARIDNQSSSNMTGVSFLKANQKWRVKLVINGKMTHIGLYTTQAEAELVCVELKKIHYNLPE